MSLINKENFFLINRLPSPPSSPSLVDILSKKWNNSRIKDIRKPKKKRWLPIPLRYLLNLNLNFNNIRPDNYYDNDDDDDIHDLQLPTPPKVQYDRSSLFNIVERAINSSVYYI